MPQAYREMALHAGAWRRYGRQISVTDMESFEAHCNERILVKDTL